MPTALSLPQTTNRNRLRLTPMTWFVILAALAIGLALGLPPDPQALHTLHTSAASYRIALAAILIPYIIIWYTAFYAYAKLREYAQPLKQERDGAGFHKIAAGMGALAFSLVIPTIISLVLNNIAQHHASFRAASVVITNYLSVFPALISLLIIYNGSRMLISLFRGRTRQLDFRWHAPWFMLLCVIFSHLALQNQHRYHVYHLNSWVLIVTYIVPYLYVWMVGLLSTYNFYTFAGTVKGLLYKQAVRRFANGIAVVIIGSIGIQFFDVTFAKRISSLGSVLLIDYVLLVIVAVGLILMALGAKKLKRIEEV